MRNEIITGRTIGAGLRAVAIALILITSRIASMAQTTTVSPDPARDTRSDTWTATDALGRTLPGYEQAGPPRKDRTVGIFYFLWNGAHINGGPYDITKILQQDPNAMQESKSPLWGAVGAPHHWGESIFGYYMAQDPYVLRKHAQMLADAGVDVVIFDNTNQITYKPNYMALLKAFSEVRAAGGKTPQVAFLTPFWDPKKVTLELYADLYKPGLYSDLWFRWEGKPLILADPDRINEGEGNAQEDTPAQIESGHTLGQTFTVKAPAGAVEARFPTYTHTGSAVTLALYAGGPGGKKLTSRRFENVEDNAWLRLKSPAPLPAGVYYLEASDPHGTIGWWSDKSDVYPDGQAYADGAPATGDRTFMIVPAGGQASDIRNFFTFRNPQPDYFRGPTAPDMWSWLEVYPQHVFKNSAGQNEQMSVGVAQNAVDGHLGSMSQPGARGRSFHNGAEDRRPNAVRYGFNVVEQWERALKVDPRFVFVTGWNEWFAGRFEEFCGYKAPNIFVDEFDQEFSRDIEPMMGGHGDDYYYQLVSYVRRYKGVRKPPAAGPPKTIRIDGDFGQWRDVRPEFLDDVGDTAHRDFIGYNNVQQYVNDTGRNDLILMKVSRDAKNLYFYARTKDPITPHTDPRWMRLFIHTGSKGPGWNGYDFIVNRRSPEPGRTVLERSVGGWKWKAVASVPYRVQGCELMLSIPRSALGLSSGRITIDFKWADNTKDDDIMSFTTDGDAAPNGRFSYHYADSVK
jgi:hypothetical protein